MIFLTPRNVEIPYEDVYFSTKDHQSLNGWFVPAKGAKITILYFQGRSSNLSDTIPFIKFFHEMGLNVFLFD